MRSYIVWWLLLLCLCLCSTNTVFAQSNNECFGYSNWTPEWFVTSVNKKYIDKQELEPEMKHEQLFFTDKDLWMLFWHFHQYCCLSLLDESKCDDKQSPYYFAMSPYLWDHLINIGFRKLDGVEDHCNVMWFDCDNRATVPNLSTERRDTIKEIAEDREWYPPAQIEQLFYKYWWDTAKNEKAYAALEQKKYAQVDTLRAQYRALCIEVANIQWWLDPLSGAESEYTSATDWQWLYKHCQDLADDRYLQEAQYVRTLMVEKWVEFLVQNLQAYSLDYFIDNRFNSLSDKYTELEWCFNTVLSYSTNTACCNE
jgi:hypothetical protein